MGGIGFGSGTARDAMKIQSLLSKHMRVVHLPLTATALEATRLMVQTRRGSVLVVDDAGSPAGIFTERDLMVRVVSEGLAPDEVLLAEALTTQLFTASPEDSIRAIRHEMQERHIRHLPVLERGRVLAVLSLRDLVRADLEETREEATALRGYIQGVG